MTLGGGAGTSTLASESSICGLDLGLRLDLGLPAGTLATGASTAGASAAGMAVGDFSDSMASVGPLARSTGISLESTATMLALFGKAGINGADFVELCAALADGGAQGWLWVKLSLCRATPDFPDYAQARPFHDALVRANPQRLLWASDWPHIRMAEKTPDVGHLLHVLSRWLDDAALQQRILVDNPALLYGFASV